MTSAELETLARALGGAIRSGRGWTCLCPAHSNRRTPALSLGLADDGRLLTYCHGGCDFAAVRDALAARGLIEGGGGGDGGAPVDPAEVARRRREEAAAEAQRRSWALGLFQEAQPAEGTPAATYLREARGIPLSVVPPSLRFHPAVKHPTGERAPAMVALITNTHGEGLGVHRTWLAPDGSGKAQLEPAKAMLGPCAGGAVRFSMDRPTLAVAEGIESSLAFAVGSRIPTLATLSTAGMKKVQLPPPPLASTLIIAADHDRPGLVAAGVLLDRARAEGRAAHIVRPEREGDDWADVLNEPDGEGCANG